MNPLAPVFATGTRVAGAVLIAGYLSGLVPGQVVSLVGGLALITFGRSLLLDRVGTALAGAALAIAAGALGIAALRWGTLSLEGLVGAQSVLGPTILIGPEAPALASSAALGAAFVATAVWSTEPRGTDRTSRVWGRFEAFLGILAAALVFAAPGTGGGLGELFEHLDEVGVAAAAIVAGTAAVLLGPRLLRSARARIVALAVAGATVIVAAAIVAGSL